MCKFLRPPRKNICAPKRIDIARIPGPNLVVAAILDATQHFLTNTSPLLLSVTWSGVVHPIIHVGSHLDRRLAIAYKTHPGQDQAKASFGSKFWRTDPLNPKIRPNMNRFSTPQVACITGASIRKNLAVKLISKCGSEDMASIPRFRPRYVQTLYFTSCMRMSLLQDEPLLESPYQPSIEIFISKIPAAQRGNQHSALR